MTLHLIARRRSKDVLETFKMFAGVAGLILLIVGAYALAGGPQ